MTIGRPRRWTKESLLLVANQRAQGLSWREIGRELGTSGSRAFELFTSVPPDPRDPVTWTILDGDAKLESLFRKCNRDLRPRPAARARRARQRPHRPTVRSRGISRSEKARGPGGRPQCSHCGGPSDGEFVYGDGSFHDCCRRCVPSRRGLAHGPGSFLTRDHVAPPGGRP